MNASPSRDVDTYHWDTVYVTSFDVLNEAIKKSGSFPTSFDYKDEQTGVELKGDWDDWGLSLSGSGSLIHMKTRIGKSGTISGLGETGDVSEGVITIQFKLANILDHGEPVHDPTSKPGTGKPRAQVIPENPTKDKGGVATFTVISMELPNFDDDKAPVLKDIAQTIFKNYFNHHVGDVRATFHVMRINDVADKGGFQWVKPSDISYAVGIPASKPTLKNSVFGALAMTNGNKIGRFQQQSVDESALAYLARGANSAFVISPELVTKHMLLKGAVSTIQGSSESDFELRNSGLNIVNRNDITWGHFKTKDSVISPEIKKGDFLMRMDGDHIHLEINNASYSPSPGITVYMNLEQDFSFHSVKREDGKFVFVPDVKSFGNPAIHTSVQVAEGIKIAEIVLGVVAGIAAVAGGISVAADFLSEAADVAIVSEESAEVSITAEDVSDMASELSEDEIDEINSTSSESTDEGISSQGDSDFVQKGSIFKSTQFRTACGLTAAIGGLAATGMAIAGPITSLDYDKLPAFDDFAANVLGASKFPYLKNYELLGASLQNSLVASIKLSS